MTLFSAKIVWTSPLRAQPFATIIICVKILIENLKQKLQIIIILY